MTWQRLKIRFALAALLAAAGCSTLVVRDEPMPVHAAAGVDFATASLVEALIGNVRSTHVHSLDAVWKGKTFTVDVVVKGNGEKAAIVILAPQMRLATIRLIRPHRIEYERMPRVPAMFAPEYAVVDVAFTLLPAPVLEKALGASFAVKDDGIRRELLCGGETVRSLERRAGGELFFRNPQIDFECRIVTLEEMP